MSTEMQLMELLAEGNPASESSDASWVDMDAAAYLATLEPRRSEMTDLETKRTVSVGDTTDRNHRPVGRRRRGLLVAAAAFAAVLAAVGIVASVLDAPTPTTVPPATTATTEAPATTSAPTTTVDPDSLAWDQQPLCCDDEGERFRVESFDVPFSVNVGERFKFFTFVEDSDRFAFVYPRDNVPTVVDIAIHGGSVDSAVETWRAIHDEYDGAEMTEPSATTLAGASGVMFSSTGLPFRADSIDAHEFVLGDERYIMAAGHGDVWIVDVNGTTVVIGYGGTEDCPFCPAPPPKTAIERAEAAARDLIESIRWRDIAR